MQQKKATFYSLALLFGLLIFCACGGKTPNPATVTPHARLTIPPTITPAAETDSSPTVAPSPTATPTPTVTPTPTATPVPTATPTPTPKTVSLLAVGDDLVHGSTLNGGTQEDGTYDFTGFYRYLKDEISAADLAIINQETILGGSEFAYSGYPRFNTPDAMGEAIVDAGFDVVLHATNHTLDKGAKGVENCLFYWRNSHPEITVLGIFNSKEEENTITVVEKNGIRIAMLNYTYSLNGISMPSDKQYLVTMLTTSNSTYIRDQIKRAKELSDFVIVFPHWGTEYSLTPDRSQKYWTNLFAEEGVDLVIGTHPHVLEPIEWVERPDGGQMLVFYSLGNFISGQIEAPRILGGMAEIILTEAEDGSIFIANSVVVPVLQHYSVKVNDGNYAVHYLADYTEELFQMHGIHRRAEESVFTMEGTWELARSILGDYLSEHGILRSVENEQKDDLPEDVLTDVEEATDVTE